MNYEACWDILQLQEIASYGLHHDPRKRFLNVRDFMAAILFLSETKFSLWTKY